MGCGCGQKVASRKLNRPYLAKGAADLAKWSHLDIANVDVTDEFTELRPGQEIKTNQSFSDGVDIFLIARTDKHNIRIKYCDRAEVIFMWEGNVRELRIHRPDGSIASAPVPLLPVNAWHSFHWKIGKDGQDIIVNNQPAFSEKAEYALCSGQVVVYNPNFKNAHDSVVDIKSFLASPLNEKKA